MNYTKIDLNTWNRGEHFAYYRHSVKCGFSLTTKIDITALCLSLAKTHYKFYPAMIYLLTKVVNQYPEFRLAIKDEELIIWDSIDPIYTVFHKKTETFSVLCTTFSPDLPQFMINYCADIERYGDNTRLYPQTEKPKNHINISSIPWIGFDGFNLNISDITDYFSPIFTMGKYQQEGGKVLLPLSVQVHHAACDGYHVALFIKKLQALCNDALM
ncbi:chloramphenicol aminotransferase [Xenorhabdus stockiae]|uniref:Chloramphenicol acetyltransferase n=1 Tax=Xenorhabdus stockiae TaxID=351614 RepID=A0A2D0KQB4_9GAMM|nr:type A chloramphenicol O-acetyltransferase [Xenorhabdus stockiae]PHM65485.1 chloramphenicol aminotransferase [Xenorhabdus stockiae]